MILSVQSVAKQMKNSLLASWQQAESNRKPALYYRNNCPCAAHAAEVEPINQGVQLESYLLDEEEELEQDANFASNNNHKLPPRTGGCKTAPAKLEFPHRKMVNGVMFEWDDSKVSPRLPNGECYICTSRKHFHRDCPHFGKWNTLRMIHNIHVEWEPAEEEEADREYLVMLAETKTVISAYKSENMLKTFARDIHLTQGLLQESFAAVKRIGLAAKEHDHYRSKPQVESSYHRVHPKHCNTHKVKGFSKGKNNEL